MVFILDFCKSSVLVVGDIILDDYWYGSITKISSESLVPIIQINHTKICPGGAANVAMNVASLGASVKLIGLVGSDVCIQDLKYQLSEACIRCYFIYVNNINTTKKLRIMVQNKQILRLDFDHYFNKVFSVSILEKVQILLPTVKILVLSDYAKGTLNNIQDIISLARKVGIPILVDPKGSDFSFYRGATILTPNLLEFESVVGHCSNEEILIKKGMEILSVYEIFALLITRSEQGMILLRLDEDPVSFTTHAKMICDVVGAGDTVIAVLATSLSSGNSIEYSCFLASVAAGIVVGKSGTSTVNIRELNDVINTK